MCKNVLRIIGHQSVRAGGGMRMDPIEVCLGRGARTDGGRVVHETLTRVGVPERRWIGHDVIPELEEVHEGNVHAVCGTEGGKRGEHGRLERGDSRAGEVDACCEDVACTRGDEAECFGVLWMREWEEDKEGVRDVRLCLLRSPACRFRL
jgi:hypothetical protein